MSAHEPAAAARPTASGPPDASLDTVLGPFTVTAEPPMLAAFAAATGGSGTAGGPATAAVPATFPIVWLARAEIRDALLALLGPGELAFHEEQAFDYHAPLEPGRPYRLAVDLRRNDRPAQVALAARVTDLDDAPVLAIRTVLRLLKPEASGANPAGNAA